MEQGQIDFILKRCLDFKKRSLSERFINSERMDVPTEDLFGLSRDLNRAFTQLQSELRSESAKFLPDSNDVEGYVEDIATDVDICLQAIENFNHAEIVRRLRRIVSYQMRNGFWNQLSPEILLEYEKEAKKLFKRYSQAVDEFNRLMNNLRRVETDFESYKNIVETNSSDSSKRLAVLVGEAAAKFSEIERILASAQSYSEEIPKIVSESSSAFAKLQALLVEEEGRTVDVQARAAESMRAQREAQVKFDEIFQHMSERINAVIGIQQQAEEAVTSLKDKSDYFAERNNYLDDLIGREVGASLFETFKQRKTEISGSIGFWKWSVLGVTVSTVAWIFFLFGNGDVSQMAWQVLLINTIKTAPVIGLLLFTISQYSKERNFQEEYAFKSAVALTINSYANQLNDKSNRDRLVMDSVTAIYKSPVEKVANKVEPKELTAVAKDLADAAKSLKG
jgi:hypothetical protein